MSSEEEEEKRQNELEPDEYMMENDTSNDTIEAKLGELVDEIPVPVEQQENSTHNMDNESSSNSIAHLNDLVESLDNENQLDSSTQV